MPGYAYRHALLRDAAYASLARAERAVLHAALAGWLEATGGRRVDEVAESIGGHYEAALAAAPALAATVAPDLNRATAAASRPPTGSNEPRPTPGARPRTTRRPTCSDGRSS